MSRKVRIIISCMLVVLAFGAGIFAYAQTHGDKTNTANADTPNFLVDKFGHIEAPVEPAYDSTKPEEEKAVRSSRGTEDNPLFILEIVPYDGMAEFGFLIGGQEPIDVDAAARDGLSFPGKDNYYTSEEKDFYFWKAEQPATFKDPTLDKTTQYGQMEYVGPDGGGNYNRSDLVEEDGHVTGATYTPATNGEFKWMPLTIEECLALTAAEKEVYDNAYQDVENVGDTFKMGFSDVEYVYKQGDVLTHTNSFLKYSVGLAFEYDANGKRDYIRKDDGSIDWDEIENRVQNYHAEVYTVTPEDLNLNVHLVERADLIIISEKAKMGSGIRTEIGVGEDPNSDVFKYIPYIKQDKIGYEEPNGTYGRKTNVSGATFDTNLIDWNVVLKIYERATDPVRICPVIVDHFIYGSTKGESGDAWSKQVTLKKMLKGQTSSVSQANIWGTQNNMAKLFLMMYQMTNPVFESFYGEVTTTDHVMFGSVDMTKSSGAKIKMKNNEYLQTGTFLYDKDWAGGQKGSDDSRKYWSDLTLLPWSVMPKKDGAGNNLSHSNVADYGKIFATYGIMCENSEAYSNNITSGDSKNSIRNGLMQYNGNTNMSYGFDNLDCLVKNNEYGSELYDFFNSITKAEDLPIEEGDLTTADCLYYLLNGLNLPNSVVNNNKQYRILELQASPKYESVDDFWQPLVAAYTNSMVEPDVTQMTTSEFIGSHVECISDFDLIYVGMNKLTTDPTMKFTSGTNFVYAHSGPKVEIADTYKALYGWLGTNTRKIEKKFLYSGNDLTTLAYNKLAEYDGEGFPILYADGFFTGYGLPNIASTIDRNSNVYKLGDSTTNSFKQGNLYGTEREHLKATLTTDSKKVDMVFASTSDYPRLYDSTRADERDWYINGYNDTNRTLTYKFTVNAPAGTTYKARLYVDVNTDGSFEDEELDITVRRLKANGNYELVSDGTVKAGETYKVDRTILDRIGSLSWKFCLTKGDKVYASISGVSAIKANSTEEEDIKVLQILPEDEDDCVLFLPTESEIASNSFENETSETFYDLVKDVNGMNITFERRSQEDILKILTTGIPEESLLPNPDYLDGFDMLVLGFADCYNGVSDPTLITEIETFINNGKAVLYTHDTSSGIGNSGTSTLPQWGATVTESYRELFGMDRYGASWYKENLGGAENPNGESLAPDKDVPYVPSDSSTGSIHTTLTSDTGDSKLRPLIQGVANGMLYRTQYTENGGSDPNVNSYHVSRVNVGAITEYPYTIKESIEIESTHPQYYQLDMEDEEMVVWYCLDGNIDTYTDYNGNLKNETREQNYEKTYFGATKNDVRNNYYIYNRRNVTYTGMGHSVNDAELGMGKAEIELFVNTFVAAYRAAAKPVRVQVTNGDATSNLAGDQFICVDVDSSNAAEIIGEDIVDEYRLQSWDATNSKYFVSESVTEKSKRVYFRLVDNNSYSNAEYEVKIVLNDGSVIDGTTKMFAVYTQDGDKLVDTKDVKFKRNTTEGNYYYVDVPITLEAAEGGRQAVAKTELTITVKMTYKIGESEFEKTGDTKVNIMPRGLFDLD